MIQILPLLSDGVGTNIPMTKVKSDHHTGSVWPVAIIEMAKVKIVNDTTTCTIYFTKWAELLLQQIAQFSSGSASGMATRTSGAGSDITI
jgi:hypothetical protein